MASDRHTNELLSQFSHLLVARVLVYHTLDDISKVVARLAGGIAVRGGRLARSGSGRWRTAIVVGVRGSSCFNSNTEFAVQTVDDFAREIAINLEVLDGDVELLKGVAEVKARGVETSDVVVGEGESVQR